MSRFIPSLKTLLASTTTLAVLGAFAPSVRAADEAPAADASPWTITSNVGVYSQYVFRGLAQTDRKPAIQGGFDVSHASGFYAGTWGSNISWFSDTNPGNSASLELDLYGGYKGSFATDFTYDAGVLHYAYPGSYPALPVGIVKPDTTEIYGALGWKWLSAKYSHAVTNTFGTQDSKGTGYLDLSASLPYDKWTFAAHVGRQQYHGTSDAAAALGTTNRALFSYTDYRVSANYDLGSSFSAGLTLTTTNARDAGYTVLGKNLGRSQAVVSISRTF